MRFGFFGELGVLCDDTYLPHAVRLQILLAIVILGHLSICESYGLLNLLFLFRQNLCLFVFQSVFGISKAEGEKVVRWDFLRYGVLIYTHTHMQINIGEFTSYVYGGEKDLKMQSV